MGRRLGRGQRQPVIAESGLVAAIAQFSRATETDTARPITAKKARTLGIVTETDTARPITVLKTGTTSLTTATETDSALAITKAKKKTVGIATTTNTAIALTRKKSRVPVIVNELDSPLPVTLLGPAPPPSGDPLLWKVSIYNLNGGVVLDRAPCQAWMFNYVLNAPGAFEADLNLVHPSVTEAIFSVGAKEIHIFRGDVLTWGGYLWSLRASATDYKATIRGEGYFSRFRRRIIADDLVKKDKDSGDIAWDLIQYSQSTHGTFGITDGHVKTNVLIDHAYCATDLGEVGAAIEELADMDDSFDFWITPSISNSNNKVFKTAVPRRGTTKAVTINQDNAISANYEIDAMDLSNRIWGVGSGDCNPPDFEASSAGSISTYGELHSTITFDDLDSLPSVKAHTREELRLNKQPRRQVTVTLEERDYTWGSFDVGDIITLASNRGLITDSRQMRVIRIQTNFNPENRIAFHEIDLDSVIA